MQYRTATGPLGAPNCDNADDGVCASMFSTAARLARLLRLRSMTSQSAEVQATGDRWRAGGGRGEGNGATRPSAEINPPRPSWNRRSEVSRSGY